VISQNCVIDKTKHCIILLLQKLLKRVENGNVRIFTQHY